MIFLSPKFSTLPFIISKEDDDDDYNYKIQEMSKSISILAFILEYFAFTNISKSK